MNEVVSFDDELHEDIYHEECCSLCWLRDRLFRWGE